MYIEITNTFESSEAMSFPSQRYPSFCKSSPCTRATRIKRDLRTLGQTQSFKRPKSTNALLQEVLLIFQRKSTSFEKRLEALQDLLSQMPSWRNWSAKENDAESSLFGDLPSVDAFKGTGSLEKIMADELIELNNNVATITAEDLDVDISGRLTFVFKNWLECVTAPNNPKCHVRDENGDWIDDNTLKDRLENQFMLHIPTRTIRSLPREMSIPITSFLSEDDDDDDDVSVTQIVH